MSIALGGLTQGLGRGIGLAQARKERQEAAARAEEDMTLRREELAARREYGITGTPFLPDGERRSGGGQGGGGGYNGGAAKIDPMALKAYAMEKYPDTPEHVIDGMLMSAGDESSFDPGVNEAAPTVPGSRGGFGLFQHTGPRRVALEGYARERNVAAADPYMQFDFAMQELNGSESRARDALWATKDAGSAAAAFTTHFLRPRADHLARRVARYTSGQGWRPDPVSKPAAAETKTETEKPLTWAAMRRIMTS